MQKLIIVCMYTFVMMSASMAKPLTFKQTDSATYAIHTRYTVAGVDRPQREAYLYRLEFQKHIKEAGMEADLYLLKKLSMVSEATEYSSGTIVGYNSGGQLSVLFDAYKNGFINGVLSPPAIFKQPLLFPVLNNMPDQFDEGAEWDTNISPILLEENLIGQVMRGTSAITNLKPAIVKSKIVSHERLYGRLCVRLDSIILIASVHGATAEYKIVTYYDTVNMLPVINIIKGHGIMLNHNEKKQPFKFYRKEILVSATFPQNRKKRAIKSKN